MSVINKHQWHFVGTEMKRVAWPPVGPHVSNETGNEEDDTVGQSDGVTQVSYRNDSSRFSEHQGFKVAPPVPPKPSSREIAHAQVRKSTLLSVWLAQNVIIPYQMKQFFSSRELVSLLAHFHTDGAWFICLPIFTTGVAWSTPMWGKFATKTADGSCVRYSGERVNIDRSVTLLFLVRGVSVRKSVTWACAEEMANATDCTSANYLTLPDDGQKDASSGRSWLSTNSQRLLTSQPERTLDTILENKNARVVVSLVSME